MPIRLKQVLEPISEPAVEAPSGWRQGLAGLLRVAGGAGSFLGPVIGAGTGAASEVAAELVEGSPISQKRILTEAALGAVPGRFFFKAGKPVVSAIRSATMAGGGDVARQLARGEDYEWKSSALAGLLGGGTGALIGRYAGRGDVPPKPPGETFEVIPTATGAEPLYGRKITSPTKTPSYTVPPVVPTAAAEVAKAGGRVPYQTGIDPFGSVAKSAAREEKVRLKDLLRIEKETAEQTKLDAIREAREAAGATAGETTFGTSTTAKTPEGVSETMRTSFKKPGKAGGGSRILSDLEAAAVEGDDEALGAISKLLGRGKDLPPVGTPAREVFDAWIEKGVDPKIAWKMAAKKGRPPVGSGIDVPGTPRTIEATMVPETTAPIGRGLSEGEEAGIRAADELAELTGSVGKPINPYGQGQLPVEAPAQPSIYDQLVRGLRARGGTEPPVRLFEPPGRPTPQPAAEVPPQVIPEAPVAPVAEPPASPLQELLTPKMPEVSPQAPVVGEQLPLGQPARVEGRVKFYDKPVEGRGAHYDSLKALLGGKARKGTPEYGALRAAGARLQHAAKAEGLPIGKAAKEAAVPPPAAAPEAPVAGPLASADPTRRGKAEELLKSQGWSDEEIAQYFADVDPRSGGGITLGSGLGGLQDIAEVIRNNPQFAARLGLGAAGAVIGAATDPFDSPVISALAGGAIGAGIPSIRAGLKSLGMTETSIGDITTPEGVRETTNRLFATTPIVMRFNYLADVVGLPANMWFGPYGSALFGALEHGISGDPRGWAALKTLKPQAFLREFANSRQEAIARLQQGELGRAEQTLLGEQFPTTGQILQEPGILMGSGDVAARRLLMAAGFSEEEARRMTLTSEPVRTAFKRAANFAKGSPFLQMLQPFSRTPANIGEQGLERMPILGALTQFMNPTDALPKVLAQQVIGAPMVGAGYLAGSQLDPETAKYVRRYLTNLGGQYSLPVGVGFAMGQARQRGQPIASAATLNALNQALPLPSVEPLVDTAKFFMTEDPTEIPRWMGPPQVTGALEELLGVGRKSLTGPLSLPARFTKTPRP